MQIPARAIAVVAVTFIRKPDKVKRGAVPRLNTRSFGGKQRKELVYIPSIEPRSFIHLSTKGDSYALRGFNGPRSKTPWVESDCKTTTELLACHPIVHRVDTAGERKNLKGEFDYWVARIADLNREYGIG